MISQDLQKQIDALCHKCPEASPIIKAIIASYGTDNTSSRASSAVPTDAAVYKEISMILPQRRKCSAHINDEGVWLMANDAIVVELQWADVIEIACVPVTDKAKPTWNLIFAKENPQNTVVLALTDAAADKHREGSKTEPLYMAMIHEVQTCASRKVKTNPSQVVPAHNGSKEGVLYMLDDAVIYGNKKPVLYLPHSSMVSFSFTVITRLTFNIVVKMADGNQYEFSIIDQDHFYGISKYVGDKGLIDESLAEARAAKRARPEAGLEGHELGASPGPEEYGQQAEDEDDRESDVDVHFSDGELNSDGSGVSASENEDDDEDEEDEEDEDSDQAAEINLEDSGDINAKVEEIQAHQLEDQQEDEDEEELALQASDSLDVNSYI